MPKYRKYAKNIGIDKVQWDKWMKKYSPNWDIIPAEIKTKIKAEEKKYRDSCLSRPVPSKQKYCYILGRTKSETKQLHNLFKELKPKLYNLPYPRSRGQ